MKRRLWPHGGTSVPQLQLKRRQWQIYCEMEAKVRRYEDSNCVIVGLVAC